MQTLIDVGAVLLGYILGSIPFGLLFVRLIADKDIRNVASGRTGGTNAARAAGAGAGLLTALMDGAKGTASVLIAQSITPNNHWVHILAPLAAILGHNYSIFLIERHTENRVRLRGGAGGGPAVGGAIGLWWPSGLIVLPLAVLVFFGIGYASVTTMSISLLITAVFAVRYNLGLAELPDMLYGLIALGLLVWALRPNIKALVEGRERFHGWRPWRKPASAFPDPPASSGKRSPPRKVRVRTKRARKSKPTDVSPARR
jgi:glycerol-3-phosphate acyltransferase PlsY